MTPKLLGKDSKMSMRMRIFGRRGSEETYEETDHSASEAEEDVGQSEHPERMSSLGVMTSLGPPPAGLFGPVPYINPRGHKLEARVEVSTLPRNTRGLNSIRGPRAQRSIADSDLHNPQSQVTQQPPAAIESTTSSSASPVMAILPSTKTQSLERRERRRRNRERCQRSRSQKSGRSQKRDASQKRDGTHPNQVIIPDNRGGAGLATGLPDTPPASDGERKKPSASKLSQLDDAILELNERLTIVQLKELTRDLTGKWKKNKAFQVSGVGKYNDIPIDEETGSRSDGESDGGESVGSIDTVGPQTYHLAVEGDVTATIPEQPEAFENQLVVRPEDQSAAEPEDDRVQFIYIVATGAANAECDIESWVKYLESYSSGHFNLTNPPEPPPMHAKFTYLPAIKSQDDQERLDANLMFRPVWESWAAFKPKFTLLVLRILERFDVTGVTVSLFDEDDEIFAVERGLGTGNNFPREHSMAAHALASPDPLIVPDALEDWRFAGHPFVTGPANIRFFAAAPLLTHGAQAIAVLSIFDSEPRLMFTPRERREFTDFADRLLTNLSNQVLYMTSAVVRDYPELQHDTWALDELASRPCSPTSDSSSVSTPIYPPLKIPRKTPTTSPTHSFGSFTSLPPLTSPPQIPLPPLPVSQPGSAASGSSSRHLGSSYHHHAVPPHMVVKPYQHYGAVPDDVVTPDSSNYPAEARPWSSSDLSSIRQAPPNTPKNKMDRGSKLRPFDFTAEDFFELSDEDVQEDYSGEQEFHATYDGAYSDDGQSYDYDHEDNRPSYQSSPRVRPASPDTDLYDASPLLCPSSVPFPEFDPERMHSSQSSGSIQSAFKLDEETESVAPSVSDDSILSYCSIPLLQRDSSIMRKYKANRKAEKAAALANIGDDMPSVSNRQSVSAESIRSFSSIPLMQRSDAELARKFKGKGKEVDFGDEMPPPKIMATEADQICYDAMRTMEYDLVYVVEIIGARSAMSNEELAQPGALKLRILATSHALSLVNEKDTFAHLEALRSRGCYGVPGTHLYFTTLNGYQYGLMAGIQTVAGPLRTKNSGIVVAALRRLPTMFNGDEEGDFMAVVEKLKGVLTAPATPKGTFKSRIPRISSTVGR